MEKDSSDINNGIHQRLDLEEINVESPPNRMNTSSLYLASKNMDFSSRDSPLKKKDNGNVNLRPLLHRLSSDVPIKRVDDEDEEYNKSNKEKTGDDSPTKLPRVSRWTKLSLVFNATNRFRKTNVVRINSAKNLRDIMRAETFYERSSLSPPKNRKELYISPHEIQNQAISEFRDQADFFKALERGSDKDMEYIRNALLRDPKKNLHDPEDPNRIANKPNSFGYTPLYVACKNGNLRLVKILLDFQANPYQRCRVSPTLEESILTVAARWGHINVVSFLLESKFSWTTKELKRAFENATNKEIRNLLKEKLGKSKKSLFTKLFK